MDSYRPNHIDNSINQSGKKMWESPIYKFIADIENKRTEILVDVTGSAPSFSEPMKQLEGAFDTLLSGLAPEETKILDFGAAKLRNTLYLLKKGYQVYACEFKDLFSRSKQASNFQSECMKYPNYHSLIFPKDFISFKEQFDVVLLINVLNVMPVPQERYFVLTLSRAKMKPNGRLLWYTQHGAYSASTAVGRLTDGLVTGKGRKYHMFYRDFSRKEIHGMLTASGFSFDDRYKFPMVGSNQAYVFAPNGLVLVDKSLELANALTENQETEKITRKNWKSKEEETDPTKRVYETAVPTAVSKPGELNILASYAKELPTIITNKNCQSKVEVQDNAKRYHRLIFNILKTVFENQLKRPKMEESLAEGTQRVDITFRNLRETGFFKQLAEGYRVASPNIYIECKNYEGDLKNPEFGQIHLRLNKHRGQFGILVCRHIENWRVAKVRLNDLVKADSYVIVLTDVDVKKLVKFKINGQEEEIDELLEAKFKPLV